MHDQYRKSVAQYSIDYVENKRASRFFAINVVGKELYLESGKIGASDTKVTKRVLPSHEEACEEAAEMVSGRVADGYQRAHKRKDHRIDYSKAEDEEEEKEGKVEEPEEENEPTDPIESEIDESYVKTITESFADLESRYGAKHG
ncbi:MAG: hypothetical protein P4M11_10630 [Candidatus Pacebacteria bacterium]|nr:hypothetical protein [Candidatus Paceibacterota bacterium]